MYLPLLKRLLLETDKRLLWKLAWNMGLGGMLSVERHKRRLKRGEVFPRAGQVEQCGAGGVWFGKTDPDLHAIDDKVETARAAVQPARRLGQRQRPIHGFSRVGGGCQKLDVAHGVVAAPQRSKRLRPAHAGKSTQPAQQRFCNRHGPAERDARNRCPQRRQGRLDLLHRPGRQSGVFVD